ncbi:type II toxin-antitoxin system RelE/ParE family toxin [Candidatus Peregrinibacteria bacterium]|nr:type II toxin-antitoxin system RelE/ParE family toxin [Candidatus Peregrinibacteria bacterium]
MIIKAIHYDQAFEEQFLGLPKGIQKKAAKAETFFRKNPFYPSLRLHKLHGELKDLWSISIDQKYRIIFKAMDDGVILFISAGLHAIYER